MSVIGFVIGGVKSCVAYVVTFVNVNACYSVTTCESELDLLTLSAGVSRKSCRRLIFWAFMGVCVRFSRLSVSCCRYCVFVYRNYGFRPFVWVIKTRSAFEQYDNNNYFRSSPFLFFDLRRYCVLFVFFIVTFLLV